MPLYASAFFLPTSPSIPFLLEDIYLRGGYRTVATIADRNAIRPPARKQGMVVFVQEDSTMYWIPGSTGGIAAWKELDITKYAKFVWQDPLILDVDEETGEHTVSISPERIVPVSEEQEAGYVLTASPEGPAWARLDALPDTDSAQIGMALVLDSNKNPIWGVSIPDTSLASFGDSLTLDAEKNPVWKTLVPPTDGVPEGSALVVGPEGIIWGDSRKKRKSVNLPLGTLIVGGSTSTSFTTDSSVMMILTLGVDTPDIRIELHNTDQFDDTNPYVFVSSPAQLFDDGTTVNTDLTVIPSRRYGFYVESDQNKKIHVKATNLGGTSVEPSLLMNVISLE